MAPAVELAHPGTVSRYGVAVHDNPEQRPEERDAPAERRTEEEAQRYPGHEDPEKARERAKDPDPSDESP